MKKNVVILFIFISALCTSQNKVLDSSYFDQVYYTLSDEFMAGIKNEENQVIDLKTNKIIQQGFEKYYVTGCDFLITTKQDSLAFNVYYKEDLALFDYVNKWVSYKLDSAIISVEVGHCEFESTIITTEKGTRYWCSPFTGEFGKMKEENDSDTTCLDNIRQIKSNQKIEPYFLYINRYFVNSPCDEIKLKEAKNCLEKLTLHPDYYVWNTLTQKCEARKVSILPNPDLTEEERESCATFLNNFKKKALDTDTISVEDILALEKEKCIIISFPNE